MNIIDVSIVLILILGGIIGFKRGFTKALVKGLGFILVIILAFILKNPLSVILYENLPFFDFFGILKGVSVLNILVYETMAFLIVLGILSLLLRILVFASSMFEKLLNMTIILGIPSKILGMMVGILEYYVIIFMILFVISLPIFNFSFINDSKYRTNILNNTPVLTDISKNTINVLNEFVALKTKYEDNTSANEFNKEALDVLLKYKVVSKSSVEKLVNKKKINISGINEILDKYKEE